VGFVYGPWQTRTVDVPGLSPSPFRGNAAVSSGIFRGDTSGDYGSGAPGSYPWRDPANRIHVADVARGHTSPNHSPGEDGHTQMDLSAEADTHFRFDTEWAQVGVSAFTTADRVIIGTYYDSFTFNMWLGRLGFGVGPAWVADIYDRPQAAASSNPKTLTAGEWAAMWDTPTPPGVYFARQLDVTGCAAAVNATLDTALGTSPTPPAITRRLGTAATGAAFFYNAATIDAEPLIGSFTGTAALAFTGETGPVNDMAIGPHYEVPGSGSFPLEDPAGIVPDSNIQYVRVPWKLAGAPDYGQPRVEWLTYDPQWPLGVDPGYDETGGIPPPDPGSTVYHGGQGVDRWATVRLQVTWQFTVRWRWLGFRFGTPPLWQRQRIGVTDSSEQYSTGLVTPQSSPWQGGTL
jgi:hypothetical protein